jgi:hypothetical protein
VRHFLLARMYNQLTVLYFIGDGISNQHLCELNDKYPHLFLEEACNSVRLRIPYHDRHVFFCWLPHYLSVSRFGVLNHRWLEWNELSSLQFHPLQKKMTSWLICIASLLIEIGMPRITFHRSFRHAIEKNLQWRFQTRMRIWFELRFQADARVVESILFHHPVRVFKIKV